MDNGLDMNAANSTAYTADVTSDTLEVKQITYAGDAAARATMERSLSQASDHASKAHADTQAMSQQAKTIAKKARAINDSNVGVGDNADQYV